jgi:hypothetical protein
MTYRPPPIPMRPKGRVPGGMRLRRYSQRRKAIYWKAALTRRERAERQAAAKATHRRATRRMAG